MTTIAAELEAIVWRRLFNELIRERRTVAIIRIFFAPVTKAGAKDVPRTAIVIRRFTGANASAPE
jgi:hypothetical protein